MPQVWIGYLSDVSRDEWAAQVKIEETRETNRQMLLARTRAAIQSNLDYLALDPPTTAQRAAQVDALTRQMVAVLRLVGEVLDDTAGT